VARAGAEAHGDRVALAATLHDTTAALATDLRRHLPALRRLYAEVTVATSPTTSPRMIALLKDAGIYAGTPRVNARGPLYRLSLRAAVRPDPTRVHYLDFDRALHWIAERPRELEALIQTTARHEVVLVGRTARAHRSHHTPLVATETEANRDLATRARMRGRVDFLVPSFVVERQACERLLKRSRTRGGAIYGELAALLLGLTPRVAYAECSGLDWETPDRDRRTVARIGLAAWRRRLDTPEEWRMRRVLAREIVDGFDRTLARHRRTAGLERI
jgi:hypothetical protein